MKNNLSRFISKNLHSYSLNNIVLSDASNN